MNRWLGIRRWRGGSGFGASGNLNDENQWLVSAIFVIVGVCLHGHDTNERLFSLSASGGVNFICINDTFTGTLKEH